MIPEDGYLLSELLSLVGLLIFLKASIRVQGLPFAVTRVSPKEETVAALNEYYEMKAHPEKYKRYSSFQDALGDVFGDA